MIFTEDDSIYSLQAEMVKSPEEITSGLWLVMAGIDGVPPHIALINDGLYYSVSARKVEIGAPIQNFLKAISKRSVPTLFIKIKGSVLRSPLSLFFERYPFLGTGSHSCLWPIRDFFTQAYSEKYSKAEFVFELLAMAEKDNLIVECKSLFLNPILEQGEGRVRLPKYTHSQIRERINSILKVT